MTSSLIESFRDLITDISLDYGLAWIKRENVLLKPKTLSMANVWEGY
jgi:hypothetical protein